MAVIDYYYDALDDAGREDVGEFRRRIEGFARRLEETAAEMRTRAKRVSVERLHGLTGDRNVDDCYLGPSLDLGDLLPDLGSVADEVLGVFQNFVGNMPLGGISESGREAHAAFRRCPPTTGGTDTEGA